MVYIFTSVFICYYLLILFFILGFNRLVTWSKNSKSTTKFSIIVPFRNEENNLPYLLKSLISINYSKELFEVILVDDESTDLSVKIISDFISKNNISNFSTIKNKRISNSPKKDAISAAIKESKFNWIITTDADCIVPISWLNSLDSFIQKNSPNMVVAPVSLNSRKSFLNQFQLLDFLSMQGSTIGGFGIDKPFMANGANLAYKKSVFSQLNGFSNNDKIASGDDVFLLEDFLQLNSNKVLFLKTKSALVLTQPVTSWKALVNQRLRWAAKAKHFSNHFTKIIGLLIFASNILVIALYILSFYNTLFLLFLFFKWIIDGILIFKTANFYQQKVSNINYLLTIIIHPIFTVAIAFVSLFSKFEWKGRRFSK